MTTYLLQVRSYTTTLKPTFNYEFVTMSPGMVAHMTAAVYDPESPINAVVAMPAGLSQEMTIIASLYVAAP